LALEPESVEAHYNLANILMELPGRGPDAIAHFQEALRLRPDYPEAHHNLALALLDQPGREAEAIAHLEAALRLDPTLGPTRALLSQLRGR
jgi:tetratricopeptide (TPR) repeat protein